MFAGLDEIDWASMTHAYGPADEVPDLVRQLVSADPDDREMALDGFYGSVHHQGDVYECTLAAIPFLLEAATSPALPGRGPIVELLASIGAPFIDEPEMGEPGSGWQDPARPVIVERYPDFLDLLADDDPEVRRAAPKALRLCGPRASAALRARFPDETDHQARMAIVAAVGRLGGAEAWLGELLTTCPDPELRFAVLTELAAGSPTTEVVPMAVRLLRELYAAPAPPRELARPATNTLIGQLREQAELDAAGRATPDPAQLVRDFSRALDDRVEERIALLTHLIGEPAWEARYDAIGPASYLIKGWRGDYGDLVRLIGDRLADPHPRVPAVAAEALAPLDALAAPAADALARALDAAPRDGMHPQREGLPPWVLSFQDGSSTIGPLPRALARLGDRRALPAIRWALERPRIPSGVHAAVGKLGSAAADLVPLIRERLRPGGNRIADVDRSWSELVGALGRLGPAAAEAIPELRELLGQPPSLTEQVVTTLGLIGPAAAEAIPTVRHLLQRGEPKVEIAAALGLWRITGDPTSALPVLTAHLDGGVYDVPRAAEALAELGPVAADAVPKLHELLRAESPWTRAGAAQALWRTAGRTEISTLTAVWAENKYIRLHVARSLAEMGAEMGAAAADAAPLMRAELGRRQRVQNSIDDDLALLAACAAVLNPTAS